MSPAKRQTAVQWEPPSGWEGPQGALKLYGDDPQAAARTSLSSAPPSPSVSQRSATTIKPRPLSTLFSRRSSGASMGSTASAAPSPRRGTSLTGPPSPSLSLTLKRPAFLTRRSSSSSTSSRNSPTSRISAPLCAPVRLEAPDSAVPDLWADVGKREIVGWLDAMERATRRAQILREAAAVAEAEAEGR